MLLRSCFRKLNKLSLQFRACGNHKNGSKVMLNENRLGDMSSKYKIFQEQDAEIISDSYEERLKYSDLLEVTKVDNYSFLGLNLERGKHGVFDIEDLVKVLVRENSENILVVKVPAEIKYVEYMCIVSGKSQKHMQAIAQFVKKVFKRKCCKNDIIPKVEGELSKDWIAVDLGNIALHIFSKKARELYDLDSLWAAGSRFDDEYNKREPVSEMLEKHSVYLEGLEPAS
ncbi:hypothetical protein NQ315_013208 [Exocentrus adspersus]|uniref:Mitochondrial assembly of ribosomal large subunit protein 1 n=1 Tax=Exocentrus adspersus TaxID=1586481 RepID=A0AAV8VCX2_9CUCU|nr:hypothetical protein NQ315_013208 [Exocentrus adspersus]